MNRSATSFLTVLLMAVLTSLSFGQSQATFWTFYNNWCMGTDTQWKLLSSPYYISTKTYAQNLGNTTHVIEFMANDIIKSDHYPYYSVTKQYADSGGPTADSINLFYNGSSNPGNGQLSSWTSRGTILDLRDSLHAHGKKLLICLQAVNATAFSAILADSAKTQVMVNAIWQFNVNHNFDGVCLNIENNETFTDAQFVAFFRMLYNGKPAGQLITSVPPPTQWTKYANVVQYHDYIMPQFYTFVSNYQINPTCSGAAGNGIFLKAPLYTTGTPTGSNHQSLKTWGPNQWYQNGWPKSKVIILLSNEANPFTTGDTLFGCAGNTTRFWADTLAYFMLKHGGTYTWNPVDIGGYIHGTSDTTFSYQGASFVSGGKFIIPLLTDQNIDSVVAWSWANGFSNFGLYDVATDTRTPDVIKNPRHYRLSQLVGLLNSGITHAAQFNTKSLSFGGVKLGLWKDLTVTIANIGSDTLKIQSITASNPAFSVRPTAQNINPLASLVDTVRFMPTSNSAVNASLVVLSSAASSPDTIKISGSGLSSTSQFNTKTLAFGSVDVGKFKDTTVTITNIGNDTLQIQSIASSDPAFTVRPSSGNLSLSISLTDTVRFTPTTAGTVNAYIVVTSSAVSSPDTIMLSGTGTPSSGVASTAELPRVYSLEQNYPNPFNPSTTIRFALPTKSHVTVRIYSVLGQMVGEIVNGDMNAGYYETHWSAPVASGLYFYRLQAVSLSDASKNFSSVRKMLLLK